MFRLVYLFVFRNDYEISDVTVFFFLLNNLIPIIKHNGRETFNFSIENLHSIYLVVRNLKLFFLEKKIWGNAPALKSKKVQGIFEETFILTLSSSTIFFLQNRISNYF